MPEDIDEVRRTCGVQRDVPRRSCALKPAKANITTVEEGETGLARCLEISQIVSIKSYVTRRAEFFIRPSAGGFVLFANTSPVICFNFSV